MIYERLLRPLLFALDPETAHQFALGCLRVTGRLCPRPTAKTTGVSAFGLNFRHRVGLAAGLDKNGVALPAYREPEDLYDYPDIYQFLQMLDLVMASVQDRADFHRITYATLQSFYEYLIVLKTKELRRGGS